MPIDGVGCRSFACRAYDLTIASKAKDGDGLTVGPQNTAKSVAVGSKNVHREVKQRWDRKSSTALESRLR